MLTFPVLCLNEMDASLGIIHYWCIINHNEGNNICTRCGYEVPGVILLHAYLYTYSLLRKVTFKVLPLSSYAFIPMMLPLLEIFLELLLWNSFQCHAFFFFFFLLRTPRTPFDKFVETLFTGRGHYINDGVLRPNLLDRGSASVI